MKILLKEYLASLKERGDIDKALLPNLLSKLGLNVINLPMIGTRQHGVDIAAVGKIRGEDTQKFLYLFCIKAGNITRANWDASAQGVREELNEILDIYIQNNIHAKHQDLPIKICLCCGGELEETVSVNWAAYTKKCTTETIKFELWNGDYLAGFMLKTLLAREILPDIAKQNFQKALAMVNDPDACYEYTTSFLRILLLDDNLNKNDMILKLNQSFICLHAVIAWAKSVNNLDTAYRISELGILYCWGAGKKHFNVNRKKKLYQIYAHILNVFGQIYEECAEAYIAKITKKHSKNLYALSAAVQSDTPLDINLNLFELIGRIALYGIFTTFKLNLSKDPITISKLQQIIHELLTSIINIIGNNTTLYLPRRDDHAIEIGLVMLFAQRTNTISNFAPWLIRMGQQITVSFAINSIYPTCFSDYDDLLYHPLSHDQEYRDQACAGSILYPYLYLWLCKIDKPENVAAFTNTLTQWIPNCTYQTWLPDIETNKSIWFGETFSGICITDVSPMQGYENIVKQIECAIQDNKSSNNDAAFTTTPYPLLLTACRHYRLPIPPNFWINAFANQ